MKGLGGAIRRRLGPVGLSLVAAAVTAVGFAAVSLADNGGNSSKNNGPDVMQAPAPPGGGAGVMSFRARLSDEDRQKLEEFRKCMDENGAPAPPEPGDFDPSQGPPDPPTKEDREKIQKAFEACKDNLPEDMRNAPGPPHLGGPGCGPPPGAPPAQGQEQGQNNQGSSQSDPGSPSSGASS